MNLQRTLTLALSAAGCDVEQVDDFLFITTPEGEHYTLPIPEKEPIGKDEEEG